MLVVGNDVVDLRHPDASKKSLDERFVGRVFLPEEKRLILDDTDPDCFLWLLWAAKETAYKIISKSHPAVHSGPLKYRVHLLESGCLPPPAVSRHAGQLSCCVETPAETVNVAIQIEADYVHAFGCGGDQARPGSMHLKVFRLDQLCLQGRTESDAVREKLYHYLGRFLGFPARDIHVCRGATVRGAGPPVLYIQGKQASIDISLSHHGRYGAFIWFSGLD